jgi:hypothetical protein
MKTYLPLALLALAACQPTGDWVLRSAAPPGYWDFGQPPNSPNEAARLIRETVPLYKEVADAWERTPSGKSELRALLAKARKVERNLAAVQMIYLSLPGEGPEQAAVERRTKKVEELTATIKTCIRQIESRL